MSGKSACRPDGRIIAPDRLCAPQTLPFSTTATGTSPRRSMISGSSASSCRSLLAHARPAGPPPTMATPTSMRSSSSSSSRLMNSCCESTSGGNWAGATTRPLRDAIRLPALLRLDRLGELGDDLVEVPDDAEVGELEDRGVRVLVDRHDVLRGLHADLVLDRAGDAGGQVQLGCDRLAGLADLRGVGVPAGVDDGARCGDGAVAAERLGQLLDELEALRLAEAAAAGHEDVGAFDVDVGAALLAALDHRRLLGLRRELDLHVLDRRRAGAGLLRLEGVEAADDDPDVGAEVDLRDRRIAEDRALGDELAAVDVDRGDLHRDAGAEARGEAGADLEAEQAAAEQRIAVAVVGDDLGHRVDHRLGQALGRPRAIDLRRAVGAQR